MSVSLQPEETRFFDAKHRTGILIVFFLFVYLVMPSTASILYFRQEINKEVQNTRRDFNKNPVTGGLLQPIMPFTAVYIQFVFL